MIENRGNKFIVFLLLINLVTTLVVGYTVYTNVSKEYNITVEASSLPEGPKDKEFETNVYNGLSNLMMGQNYINIGLLRVHHYVEPHADQFYENCPECKLERQQILEKEKESVTSNTEGL